MLWTKEDLTNLYHSQGKTLAEIGNLKGVTREYVRQHMAFYNIPRIKNRKHLFPSRPRAGYESLSNYLANSKASIRSQAQMVMKYFSGTQLQCSECGSLSHIHFHHIKYTPNSLDDLQILCASCHNLKHKGKMTLAKQVDLFNEYNQGIPYKELMQKYGISRISVYNVIRKLKNGWHTLKG